MAITWEQLAEQAVNLPTESRGRLVDLLVKSLDADELRPIDRVWVAEAKRRRMKYEAGMSSLSLEMKLFKRCKTTFADEMGFPPGSPGGISGPTLFYEMNPIHLDLCLIRRYSFSYD